MTEEKSHNTSAIDKTEQTENTPIAVRPSRHVKPKPVRNTLFYIRQALNILFMLTSIVGVMMYCGIMGKDVETRQGIIVIVIAVSIKMAECMLRLKR